MSAATGRTTAVEFEVRAYELDTQRHLNSAVYHQWAEHARWSHLAGAGITPEHLVSEGIGPVLLEETIRYRRELRLGDVVRVSCCFEGLRPGTRTFTIRQEFRLRDGTLAAELECACGLLDLADRSLVADPDACLRRLAGAEGKELVAVGRQA